MSGLSRESPENGNNGVALSYLESDSKVSCHVLRLRVVASCVKLLRLGLYALPGFVAQAFMGANLDNWALPGVYLGVVMGRHAGFLTAASALGKKFPDDGPHLIYMPERSFSIASFLADVKATMEKYGRCVIALSEGIHDSNGVPMALNLVKEVERDAHGNVQLSGTGALADLLCGEIKAKLPYKRVRADTFGYMQRCFVGCVSDVDQREAREVGEKAVQYAMWGDTDGSVTIHRTGFYSVDYQLSNLRDVAGKTRTMPR